MSGLFFVQRKTMTSPIIGFKGGESSPRPAVEAPDSLQSIAYARVLDLVSEGEIRGLVNGMRSVFLDETPLANGNGGINFSGVTLDTRTGSQDQQHIAGYPAVESESSVGVELRSDQPWVRSVSNAQLSAVRIRLSVPRLSKTDSTNGDTNGYKVRYAIDVATGGGAFVQVLSSSFSGKTTTKYERSHRIDLPASNAGWTIRVRRTTPNESSGLISDTTTVEAITEVIDAKLRYPGSAVIGLQFDASQFQAIPTRAFDLFGRIIRVPSNYDPATRVYIGAWDGSFKLAWTDNPAWIFYDLLLHFRYGLGHLLNAAQVDKWELYRISQYCDQMVPNGKGDTEPRFTCNLYLQTRADAIRVLQDLATTFRGLTYWAAGSVMAVADMPEDPVYTYSNANVVDGKFNYSGTSKKSRYTVALVSWNDPADFYRQKVEYVDDQAGIARYGIQQTEITATGCTSQAQAQRVGKWALLTNRLETETVSFSVGLDGCLARPGQIIRVADNDRAGRRIGGRLRSATLDTLVLDADVMAYPGDTITLIMPTGKAVSRGIKSVGYPLTWDSTGIKWDDGTITMDTTGFPAEVQQVVLESALDDLPPRHSMWAIDSPSLATQQFRVMSVAEDFSSSEIKFTISGVRHNASKYGAIDNGTRIEQPPITVIPPSVQAPPASVTVSNDHFVDQGSAISIMTIEWERPEYAIAFEVYWRKNDGDWIYAGRTGTNSIDVSGIYAGRYVAKVRAINSLDIGSVFATSVETLLEGKTTPPPVVSAFTAESIIFGIKLKWGIPAGVGTADLQRTEVWYSEANQIGTATKLGDYAYPQTDMTMMGLAAGKRFFFWARLVDRIGNVGAYFGPVTGQASADAGPILDYLNEQITESQLSQALAEKINTPDIDLGPVYARINEEREERIEEDTSLASRQTELEAGQAQTAARVTAEETARADADSALGQRVDSTLAVANQASETADEAYAQTEVNATSLAKVNGDLSAMYSIKTQLTVNGVPYMAGIGIGVENNEGIITSQVLIAASRFAVIDPNTEQVFSPFIIQDGSAYMRSAFIQDGAITNAKIGDFISSLDYVAGQTGWRLDKSGTLEFNGTVAGGGRLSINNQLVQVFDSAGVLRVRLGIWA